MGPTGPPGVPGKKAAPLQSFFLQAPCFAVYPVFNLISNVGCLFRATLSGRQDCSSSLDVHGSHPSLQKAQYLRQS